jgi:hypothetical protein
MRNVYAKQFPSELHRAQTVAPRLATSSGGVIPSEVEESLTFFDVPALEL